MCFTWHDNMETYGGRRYDSIHIYLWHQLEVTLERGKQDQVLIDRRLGEREKEIVLKLRRKENSLSLAQNQTPLLDKTAFHFATTLTEPVSTLYIKESRNFKNL